MFDIGWPELFLIAVVVLLVVGPKDLPKVLRNVGLWVGKAKVVTREFRTHVDDMIRDSELKEVRDQINEAGDVNLDSITDNTIGIQDEVEDVLELEEGAYTGKIFEDDVDLYKNESDEHSTSTSIENEKDEPDESKEEFLTPESGTAN
mgnify:CR=1 FL=1